MIKKIAVLAGDGIGPEITREGLKVLEAIARKYGHTFDCQPAPFGAEAYFKHGHPFPEETKKICDEADAIIKGPIGLAVEKMNSIPDHLAPERAALLPLRGRYDTFANYRPVVLPVSLASLSPLKEEVLGNGIEILMLRELVGGIYFGKKVEGQETNYTYAADNCEYTKEQVARIAHVAFKEARKRQKPMTNVHKANVLATSRFWNKIVEDIHKADYQDVQYKSILVDNAAYQLVKAPGQFNGVMLFENMQGDILTDQAGGVLGSLGLMPSACIGPEKGYVEPAHGSAPDIAGKNIANPYSMIGSVALMLDTMFGLQAEANEIWQAMLKVLTDGYRTSELAVPATPAALRISTEQFGNTVVEYIQKH
jgi:3-isopropylmalate dehydrogenase